MERLTKVIGCWDESKIYDISNELYKLTISRADKTKMILQKLAEYEDLEEQGRLIKLPCKVRDTIYGLHKAMVCELDTETIGISKMPSGEYCI